MLALFLIVELGGNDRSMGMGVKIQSRNVYYDIYKYIFRQLIEVIELELSIIKFFVNTYFLYISYLI